VQTIQSDDRLLESMDDAHALSCAAQLRLLEFVAEADRRELWWTEGARDTAHLLSMRYGISGWKAQRWVAAALALRDLPHLRDAFGSGRLGIDKVVELVRFATPDTEESLIRWAEGVPSGRIREEGDLAARRAREEVENAERARSVEWWFHDEGRRFALMADLPAAEGAVMAKAIERMAERVPISPEDDEVPTAEARRADALVALVAGRGLGGEATPPTVVVHVPVHAVGAGPGGVAHTAGAGASGDPKPDAGAGFGIEGGFAIEGGGVVGVESLSRLLCHARLQTVVENGAGDVVQLGRISRDPPEWMLRQLRYRDRGCVFPGCGERRFAQAHHVRWWSAGGRTDLGNLVLACTTHHKLVHEFGWSLTRRKDGTVRWYRPDGRRHRTGPAPPRASAESERPILISA